MKIKVFDYIPELDAFVVREEYKDLVERLGVSEWTPVVWICRLLGMDNDYCEHMFDNWDERAEKSQKATELNIDENELMIVVPERFRDHSPYCMGCYKGIDKAICPECKEEVRTSPDGPCHSDAQRKRFWTDVLDSLTLDLETIFEEARASNEGKAEFLPEEVLPIEEIIQQIREEYK